MCVIAEVGVNHNGSLDIAKQIIDEIAMLDIDYIKFQTLIPELLAIDGAPKAEYQKSSIDDAESSDEMLRGLALTYEDFRELKMYIEARDLQFLSTAFDLQSLDFLVKELGIKLVKIPSGEITNLPFLERVAQLAEEVILSTGMSEMFEIRDALEVLVSGGIPVHKITVLQCNTAYPTPMEDVNLRVLGTFKSTFGTNVGFSDHTNGSAAAIASVAMGARVVEKHVTLDKSMPGPDHYASMEPDEFRHMVQSIRDVERMLGSDIKTVTKSEQVNVQVARRGLYAARDIEAGERIEASDLLVLRPVTEISPMKFHEVVGLRATKAISKNQPLSWDLFASEGL